MRALYHFELQEKGHQATLEVEYDETKRDRNPHYHEKTKAMEEDLQKVSASLDRGLWNKDGYSRYSSRNAYSDDISAFCSPISPIELICSKSIYIPSV